jgi:antitoxin (DNA-binding transcriptional repressor) of toxin-antitoxin stability system
MTKEAIHLSETKALEAGLLALLARERTGAEIVIERDGRPTVVLRPVEPHPGRLLSEPIALARAHG